LEELKRVIRVNTVKMGEAPGMWGAGAKPKFGLNRTNDFLKYGSNICSFRNE
jgi:hypothetical protein